MSAGTNLSELTDGQRRLAAMLLREAANVFSNHGCNDFPFAEIITDVDARRAIMKGYHEFNGDPEEFDSTSTYETEADFMLMSYMAHLLDGSR